MRTATCNAGDIVEIDRKGRRFMATVEQVTAKAGGALLAIRPLDRNITFREARAYEVVNHWRKVRTRQREEVAADADA